MLFVAPRSGDLRFRLLMDLQDSPLAVNRFARHGLLRSDVKDVHAVMVTGLQVRQSRRVMTAR